MKFQGGLLHEKSIAIDMDQVLADFYSKLRVTYNDNFGTKFTDEEFLLTTQRDLPREDAKKLFALLNERLFQRFKSTG